MPIHNSITITLHRRLLEHPRAYHLRRMRLGLWLYLDLLARLSGRAGSLDLEPAAVGRDMGLSEGTIRSWLGHLRKSGYIRSQRQEGTIRVILDGKKIPAAKGSAARRSYTPAILAGALGERGSEMALEAALHLYSDRAIERALGEATAVPQSQIRHSRTALFLYLLKQYETTT